MWPSNYVQKSIDLKMSVHIKTCMQFFITVLFIITKSWNNQDVCPSMGEYTGVVMGKKHASYDY